MPDTPRGYPYPVGPDPNDVPADIQALAEALDDDVQAHVDSADPHPTYETATEAAARVAAHVAAGHPTVPVHDAQRHRFVGVKATKNVQQVIGAGSADTVIVFGAEEYDTDGIHSTSANTGRLTLPFAGYWELSLMLRALGTSTAPLSNVRIRKNGTTVIRTLPDEEPYHLAGGDSFVHREKFLFGAGEYVEIIGDVAGIFSDQLLLAANANCQFGAEYRGA